jgi:hypothetical protein
MKGDESGAHNYCSENTDGRNRAYGNEEKRGANGIVIFLGCVGGEWKTILFHTASCLRSQIVDSMHPHLLSRVVPLE